MKKFVKILSLLAIAFVMTISLASCSYDFFGEYNEHEAELKTDVDYSFEVLTVDQVKNYRDNKKSFVLFMGTPERETCVTQVQRICEEAINLNYKGIFLYVDTTDMISPESQKEAREKLGVNDVSDTTYGLIAVCYREGSVYWDTTKKTTYKNMLLKFTSSSNDVETGISFRAITDYVIENYSLESIDKL